MTTDADVLLQQTIEHIDAARKNLALITTDQVPGANGYHTTYQQRMRTALGRLQRIHDMLNNRAQEPM